MAPRPTAVLLVALALPAVATHAQQKLPPVVTPQGNAAVVAQPLTVERRLARLERLLDSGTLIDMAIRLDQLQAEMQQLRGQLEVQGRDIEVLKQRQRDLYQDIDRRLRRLEVAGSSAAPAIPMAPPAVPTAPLAPPVVAAPAIPASTPPVAPPVTAPLPVAPAVPTADPAQVQLAYQGAFDLLKEGRYGEAIEAFQQFLVTYPGGAYTDNAQYWLGEANYVTRNFPVAVTEFGKVLGLYPASPKIPDAMLKLGYAHYELQDWPAARAVLTELREKHPTSTAARLAASRLQRMAQEGR